MRQTYSNNFGKVYQTVAIDRKNNWVYNDWTGYFIMDNVKSGVLAYLNAVKRARFFCVLNDNSSVLGSWGHSLDWGAAAEWSLLAAEAGVKHFALIRASDDSMAESSDRNFSSCFTAFYNSVFYTITEAKGWLGYHSLGAER